MNSFQKTVKYGAIALAVSLIIAIIGGILSAAGLFTLLFEGGSGTLDEIKTYTVNNKIMNLEIEIGAAELTVKEGEAFLVESNLKNISVKESGNTLKIKEKSKFDLDFKSPLLTVYIPKDAVFENVDIITGAGRFNADEISAESISLELGAGEVNINELNASLAAKIEGGAGALTVNAGTLTNLELEMGIGKLTLTSSLMKKAEIECGVGEANINLMGSKEEYTVLLSNGIGEARFDGKKIQNDTPMGNGTNKVEVDGGIGSINIEFVR